MLGASLILSACSGLLFLFAAPELTAQSSGTRSFVFYNVGSRSPFICNVDGAVLTHLQHNLVICARCSEALRNPPPKTQLHALQLWVFFN